MTASRWTDGFSAQVVERARALVRPQVAPADTGSEPCWPLVVEDLTRKFEGGDGLDEALMHARDEYGREKYGVPITADNGRDHLVDALQEQLDYLVYLRAEIRRGDDSGLAARLYGNALRDLPDLVQAVAQARGWR